MKPWIDPMERRARLWWSTQFVVAVLALITAVSLLLWAEQTGEERIITSVAVALTLAGAGGSAWQLKKTSKDGSSAAEEKGK
jgi:protein-S-isoprenylcysteine O-methyltransferase Ste14